MRILRALLLIPLYLLSVSALHAQEREVPYWASLRSPEVNMRVGPSSDYPIDWVYHRQFLPVKVVMVREGWRLVQDWEGTQGWMVASLLSPDRTAQVIGEGLAAMRSAPDAGSALRWNAEPGLVGSLGKCENGWCEFDVAGRKGWVQQERLWGTGEP